VLKGHLACKNWVVGCWHGYLSGARCRLAYKPSWCHCHSLSLASVKSILVLPFWYWLTRVVLDRGPLNGCNNNNNNTMPSYYITVLWRRRSKVHSSLIFVLFCIAYRNFFHSLGIEYRSLKIIIIIISVSVECRQLLGRNWMNSRVRKWPFTPIHDSLLGTVSVIFHFCNWSW